MIFSINLPASMIDSVYNPAIYFSQQKKQQKQDEMELFMFQNKINLANLFKQWFR